MHTLTEVNVILRVAIYIFTTMPTSFTTKLKPNSSLTLLRLSEEDQLTAFVLLSDNDGSR